VLKQRQLLHRMVDESSPKLPDQTTAKTSEIDACSSELSFLSSRLHLFAFETLLDHPTRENWCFEDCIRISEDDDDDRDQNIIFFAYTKEEMLKAWPSFPKW
jgi:hypothetical protein